MPKGITSSGHGSRWKGGRQASGHGYVRVHVPNHPRASKKGTVYEHILLAERALGRYLPDGAEVHHVDEDKSHNVGGNLVICQDRGYHLLLHQRQRALDACGDANARRCYYCRTYGRQADIVVQPRPRDGKVYEQSFHPDCRRAYQAARGRAT
jgi:hypothetical protein